MNIVTSRKTREKWVHWHGRHWRKRERASACRASAVAVAESAMIGTFGVACRSSLRLRLVDRDEVERAARRERPQLVQQPGDARRLRRDVEHVKQRRTRAQQRERLRVVATRACRRDGLRAHALALQRRHLVLHQRDQRTDHEHHALAQHRRQLEAKRLSYEHDTRARLDGCRRTQLSSIGHGAASLPRE
eukprot:6210892-Pleurochrysis_carterae.AAC.2